MNTVTIPSRCHEHWVPEWPHSHRIDEFGNLAIMSRCHRPEVAEWNDMDRLDDLVNAMHCRTGAVEPGTRPALLVQRFHLSGMHRRQPEHNTILDRYMTLPGFTELHEQGLRDLCPTCVERLHQHQHGLIPQ